MEFDYPVRLTPAPEGGFTVTFPDVPGAVTEGDDRDEALLRAADALETILAAHVREGKDVPAPSKRRGPSVRPSPLSIMKLAVYRAMRDRKVGKAELARRLGWHLPQVDRVLDLRHASRLDQIEAAFRVLGMSLRVDIVAAA